MIERLGPKKVPEVFHSIQQILLSPKHIFHAFISVHVRFRLNPMRTMQFLQSNYFRVDCCLSNYINEYLLLLLVDVLSIPYQPRQYLIVVFPNQQKIKKPSEPTNNSSFFSNNNFNESVGNINSLW